MNKTAEKILDATIRHFIREGIRKATMDALAEISVVSKVTIYKYFKDKDALFSEINNRILSGYTLDLERIAGSGDILIKRMLGFLDVISDFVNSGRFDLCRELARYDPRIEDGHELYKKAYRRAMLALIDEGLQSGLIKKEMDSDMVFYYIDMGVAYYQQSSDYRNRMSRDEKFKQHFMLFYVSNIFVDGEKLLLKPMR
jgi:AcrR family transcriptional regulator